MRVTKKQQPKIIQELQPNKTCKCGACEPRKPKLPEGLRRLKVQPKYMRYTWRSAVVPQIMLQGEWLRKTGFECEQHVIITVKNKRLIIKLEKE
ncbi:SymE family type I addiction module toxin [Pedobacter insulae]|uniref:SymE family type I addiction module toxin n=1 Tax=Pedobacter insulae TaxID=414048 RepID=UPI000B85B184